MLAFLSVLIILAMGYAFLVEGLFTAFLMFCNVFLSGLIAFNFWEPLADQLDMMSAGTFFHGYEDWLALTLLFCVSLGILRTLTNTLDNTLIEFDEVIQRAGGAFFGLMTGYLLAGFLVCLLETLPWQEKFLSFEPRLDPNQGALGRVLPPGRVWLALMHRAGAVAFTNSEGEQTFDQYGTFELRFQRYRRYNESREAIPYGNEFEHEIHRAIRIAP
jgi:hypothetical protein